MRKLPELLAPAGDLDCIKAAVSAGADAVYFGGRRFNARSHAGNLSENEISQAVSLCRRYHVRTNLTLNTLIKESEWDNFVDYADQILPLGIDAVIVQDPGVASFVAAHYPDIALHASTQMAVEDLDGVLLMEQLGFSRVVLAREVSLEEIRKIRSQTDMELEVFVHGALCYSYSGRCLLSSFHGGRSGNRGGCAQPCRLFYDSDGRTDCYMNMKDRAFDRDLSLLVEAGVSSLKMEGRMKGPAYVAGVTSYYRDLLDRYARQGTAVIDEEKRKDVMQLFNRGSFTNGYLTNKDHMIEKGSVKNQGLRIGRVTDFHKGSLTIRSERDLHAGDQLEIRPDASWAKAHPDQPLQAVPVRLAGSMISPSAPREAVFKLGGNIHRGFEVWRVVDPVLTAQLVKTYQEPDPVPLDMDLTVAKGQPVRLKVRKDEDWIEVHSEQTAQEALKQPVTKETLKEQLSRLGGTGYQAGEITIHLDPDSFIPVSVINQLRRRAVSLADDVAPVTMVSPQAKERKARFAAAVEKARRDSLGHQAAAYGDKKLEILAAAPGQLKAIGDLSKVSALLLSMEGFEKANKKAICCEFASVPLAVSLPNVGREKVRDWAIGQMKEWIEAGVTAFEAQLPGQIRWIRTTGGQVWMGPMLGIMNKQAAYTLLSLMDGQETQHLFASLELTLPEIRRLSGVGEMAVLTAGRIPYMISEQCVYKERYGCQKREEGHRLSLTDRSHETMTVLSHCRFCYSEIYSEKPVFLENRKGQGPDFTQRVQLTLERPDQAALLIRDAESENSRRGSLYQSGHFEKGVL